MYNPAAYAAYPQQQQQSQQSAQQPAQQQQHQGVVAAQQSPQLQAGIQQYQYQQQLAAAMAMQRHMTAAAPAASATPPRFKTRMCAYANGNCPYAARGRCFFAHSADELRAGAVTTPRVAPDASKRKTKMCSYFLQGHCPYAATNSCLFAHSEQERQAALYSTSYQQQPVAQQHIAQQPVAQQAVTQQAIAQQHVAQQPITQQPIAQPQAYDATMYYNQVLAQQHQYAAAMAAQQPGQAQQPQYHMLQHYMASYQQQWAAAAAAAAAAAQHTAQPAPMALPPLPQNPAQPRPSPPSAIYYKTKVCKFGDACPYRQAGMCRFAHSTEELRSPFSAPSTATLTAPLQQEERKLFTSLAIYPLRRAAPVPGAAVDTIQSNNAKSVEQPLKLEQPQTEPQSKPLEHRRQADDDDQHSAAPSSRRPRTDASLFAKAIARCARPLVMTYLEADDLNHFLHVLSAFKDDE